MRVRTRHSSVMPPTQPARDERSREQLKKDERELGENIPDEMVGLDSEDAARVERRGRADAEKE